MKNNTQDSVTKYYVICGDIDSDEYVQTVYKDEIELTTELFDAIAFDDADAARALCRVCEVIDSRDYNVVHISKEIIRD